MRVLAFLTLSPCTFCPFSSSLLHFYCQLKKKNRRRGHFYSSHTIIQSITSSEMCSLYLTHPSAHTLGVVGSQCCDARGAVGGSVPCSSVSRQSWTIPAGAEIRTSGNKSDALSIRPRLPQSQCIPHLSYSCSSCLCWSHNSGVRKRVS